MDVHVLQHVSFEGPAAIADWALDRGHDLRTTQVSRGDRLPDPATFDLLVVLGGPMSVGDDGEHPWLAAERESITTALAADRQVLGICLGAQQLAAALGAEVVPHDHTEIGWYPVSATAAAADTAFGALPAQYPALHWHGDSFELPEDATLTATSEACRNQAFVAAEGRAVGLQFHLEATPASVDALVDAGGVPDGPWVQSREELLARTAPYEALQDTLYTLLDRLVA